jgi:hypothetical protein
MSNAGIRQRFLLDKQLALKQFSFVVDADLQYINPTLCGRLYFFNPAFADIPRASADL